MQVHVSEIRVGGTVHRPALPVMAGQAVALRERLQQLPSQPQALGSGAGIQQFKRGLGAVNLPAPCIRIQKEVEQTIGRQQSGQGAQPRLRLIEMVQHPYGIDVVEGAFP